jgi:HEAT repeat protein
MDEVLIKNLLEQLGEDNPQKQVKAIYELFNARVHIPMTTLKILAVSPYWNVRAAVADIMGYANGQEIHIAGSVLLDLLNDAESAVRGDALDSLGQLNYIPARKLNEDILVNDPDALVRASAAETLGKLGSIESVDKLTASLINDENEMVKAIAAYSIGLIGSPATLEDLKQISEVGVTQIDLLCARYMLGEQQALNLLLELLQTVDKDASYRLINRIDDLMSRIPSKKLVSDAPNIKQILGKLVDQLPEMKYQLETMLEQLSSQSPDGERA